MTNRRDFIQSIIAGGAGIARSSLSSNAIVRAIDPARWPLIRDEDPWSQASQILARIKAPVFPARDFPITKFGAVGNGNADCTEAFAKAIDACNKAGGGRVVVPAGEFLTGAIHLKSNINLHLAKNATIKFSRDPKKYLPVVFTRWEGMELMSYSAFIYAFEQKNIAITGEGIIDGKADCEPWWPWAGLTGCVWKQGAQRAGRARAAPQEMVAKGTPVSERVFGEGSYLRPNLLQPYRCQNVLIEGVTLK